MSTAVAEPEPMTDKPPYRMPEVEVGQIVWWYVTGKKSKDHPPRAAVVTKINNRSLCISIIEPDNGQFLTRDGVRFVGDPDNKEVELQDNGAWDFTDQHRRFSELEKSVRLMHRSIQVIETNILAMTEKTMTEKPTKVK